MIGGTAFLTAVFAALDADTALRALFTAQGVANISTTRPIFLGVAPPDQAFPFVVFNIASDLAWDTADRRGQELRLDVTAYSRASEAAARALIDQAITTLDDASLSPTGWRVVFIRRSASRVDSHGDHWGARAEFRALIQRN